MEFGLTSSLARRSPSWCNWWKHSSRIRRWLIWSVVDGICGLWLVVNDCYWLVLLFLSFLWYIQNSEIQNMLTQLDMPRPFRTAGLVAHWTPVRRPVDSVTKIRWVFRQQNWDFYGFLLVFSPIFPSSSTGWDVKSLRLGGRRAGATYPRLRRFSKLAAMKWSWPTLILYPKIARVRKEIHWIKIAIRYEIFH